MKQLIEARLKIKEEFPDFEVAEQQCGLMYSFCLRKNDLTYLIDITENQGIGITYREIQGLDFAGSDEVFLDIESAIRFLKKYKISRINNC